MVCFYQISSLLQFLIIRCISFYLGNTPDDTSLQVLQTAVERPEHGGDNFSLVEYPGTDVVVYPDYLLLADVAGIVAGLGPAPGRGR